MNLSIEPEVLALFPEAVVGVIEVRGCDNATARPAVEAALRHAEAAARARFAGVTLGEEPRIACWREAYRRFGASAKKNPPSVESLVRRAVKGDSLRPINPLVDLYNTVSLERLLPAGGEDLAAVRGDIVLCRAGEGEPPVLLLGDAEARPPHPGEVIYRDAVSALCRRWNWKEAQRTKLTAATRDAVLVLEALPPTTPAELAAALADLAGRIAEVCGGSVRIEQLGVGRPSVALLA